MGINHIEIKMPKSVASLLIFQGILSIMPSCSKPDIIAEQVEIDVPDLGNARIERDLWEPCPDGWTEFGDQCYLGFGKELKQLATWANASQHCRRQGSSLASIHSKSEQDFLRSQKGLLSPVWIGLHLQNPPKLHHWEDGSPLDFTNWKRGEPSSGSGKQEKRCVQMPSLRGGEWSSERCSLRGSYICQRFKRVSSMHFDMGSGDGETETETSCNPGLCQNGGSCTLNRSNGSPQCRCARGYKGDYCENAITNPGNLMSEYIDVIAGVLGVIALIIIATFVVLFLRMKKKKVNNASRDVVIGKTYSEASTQV